MHKRPSLTEALSVLAYYSSSNEDCKKALEDYHELKTVNQFLASRVVVDTVDHFNHIVESEGLLHGKK